VIKKRGAWGTRYGFYLAAIGSAFGLGNLWRFPYVVGSNGGGAFVLFYLFFALAIGLSIVIAELILGKASRQSVIGAIDALGKLDPTSPGEKIPTDIKSRGIWRSVGFLAIGASVFLLSYYAVISGWVLHFFTQTPTVGA
jgi:NSS family neurotransmitter:Na+ symporter